MSKGLAQSLACGKITCRRDYRLRLPNIGYIVGSTFERPVIAFVDDISFNHSS
ncbi:hypothetical protein CROQUDRAFT_97799 [Cronartium quercuum f. sp. fusiforme G11]|uniref:Uncharacterized protein n=1 Tax=Cronartium quercuum f. sp. fusiforme G11 TaxID=708437 RepID=A0A9P6NAT8_9BASI|nr:hypothetical protein CROQUDRAFT_97799 [Cronartium quercuum f. sp. fusiforme G11]